MKFIKLFVLFIFLDSLPRGKKLNVNDDPTGSSTVSNPKRAGNQPHAIKGKI